MIHGDTDKLIKHSQSLSQYYLLFYLLKPDKFVQLKLLFT